MKKNFKTVFSVLGIMCLITAMFYGCAQTSRAPGQYYSTRTQNMRTQGYAGNNLVNATTQLRQGNMTGMNQRTGVTMNQTTNIGMGNNAGTMSYNQQRADNIKRQLTNMNGLRNVNVMVMGNTALVGCEPTGNTMNTTAVRNNIIKKVKQADPSIVNVTVSESTDIINQMKRLGSDMTNNRPMKTITEDFNRMINGLTPAK